MGRLILGFLLVSSIGFTSEYQELCDSDQTGELYSALYDVDRIETAFTDLGIDAYKSPYKELIAANPDFDIFDFVEKFAKQFPGLQEKFDKRLSEECDERVHLILKDQQ